MIFIFQRWEPVSMQQRHGSSIVEVYRIVEEVSSFLIIHNIYFFYMIDEVFLEIIWFSPYSLFVFRLSICFHLHK